MYRHPLGKDLVLPFMFIYPGGKPADISRLSIDMWLHAPKGGKVNLCAQRPVAGSEAAVLNCIKVGPSGLTAIVAGRDLTPGQLLADIVISGIDGTAERAQLFHELPVNIIETADYRKPDGKPKPDYREQLKPNWNYGHDCHIATRDKDRAPTIYVTLPKEETLDNRHVTDAELAAALDIINRKIDEKHVKDPNDATEADISDILGVFND